MVLQHNKDFLISFYMCRIKLNSYSVIYNHDKYLLHEVNIPSVKIPSLEEKPF